MQVDLTRRCRYWRWRISELRGREFSQSDLANDLGLSRATVSGWERGEFRPSHENIRAIEDLAGVPEGTFHLPVPEDWE